MDSSEYYLKIDAVPTQGIPHVDARLGGVNVILGANGSGKSRLLAWIRDRHKSAFGGPRPVVFVEGGRAVPIPAALEVDRHNFQLYENYDKAIEQHTKKRTTKLSDRIKDALFALERRTVDDKTVHSDAVNAWIRDGSVGTCPARPEPPLDRLFRLFSEVLPNVELTMGNKRQLTARRNGTSYSATSLSDGEKQTLAILSDIAILAERNSLFLVDEPELNLHPLLAAKLWSAIEIDCPSAVFIYTTHSIEFAMRPEVSGLVVVSATERCVDVRDQTALTSLELRPFLGAIPAVLASDRALVVEGADASFDRPFYQWLTGEKGEVVPFGSGSQVLAATSADGIWQRLAPGVRVVGVIDRDYRNDGWLASKTGSSCAVLDYHEAESYVCDPTLLAALASRLGLVEDVPDVGDIETMIREFAEPLVMLTAAQRAFERASIQLAVSLPRAALTQIRTDEEMIAHLRRASVSEAGKMGDSIGPEAIEGYYAEELEKCRSALSSGDIRMVLRVFPGKELLRQLAPRVGCANAAMLARAVRSHLDPQDFESTRSLRDVLQRMIDGERSGESGLEDAAQ